MDWQDTFNRFILNNDKTADQFIDSVSIIEFLTIINNWQLQFSQNLPATFTKLVCMAPLVSRFEKTRTECL